MSPATKTPTKTVQFRSFAKGLNRTDARTAIKDDQSFNMENFQPIGQGQLKSLPPPADPIATIAAGIASLWGISIRLSRVVSVVSLTQAAGTATATTSGDHGYVSGNVIAIRGAVSTPANAYNLNAIITVTGLTTFTYAVDPAATTPATGTITAQQTPGTDDVGRLIAINTDGSIDAIDPLTGFIVNIGPAGTVTAEARLTMWQDTPLLIGDPTKGYFSWDGTTLVHYPLTTLVGTTHTSTVIDNIVPGTAGLSGGTPGTSISGSGIPAGASIVSVDSPTQITISAATTSSLVGTALTFGTGAPTSVRDLQVFEGRVWLVTASRTITFTAPNSYTDFATTDAAGTAQVVDSVFEGPIVGLLSALELLWIIGKSSINSISNVNVVVSLAGPLTLFSNTNIVANVGSVRRESVSSFFRTFLFFAPYGVYAIVGATPQKLSDDLDGLFPLLHTTAGHHNPSAVFALNEVFIWAVLVHYDDPLRGHRPVLLCFAKNAWFMASQGALDWITSLVDAQGNPQLWGSDGHHVYQCFAGTGPHDHLFQTKLWDFGAFTQVKQALRVAAEFVSDNPVQSTLSIDTGLTNSVPTLDIAGGNVFNWTGLGGAPFMWTGFGGAPFTWISGGLQLPKGPANASGYYLGMKLEGTSLPFTLSGLALELNVGGEWAEVTP